MKILLLGICLMLTSLSFGQTEDTVVYYDLYWYETVTFGDNSVEHINMVELEPSPEFFEDNNITKWDTIGILSYMGRQVVDSLNKLRVNKGLPIITNYDEYYADNEYGYAEQSVFDYMEKVKTPLMVTDFYYDMGGCSCVDGVIGEIMSHDDIMKRVLSKRNKVLNVCIIIDKKTNIVYIYVQVKRFLTLTYFIS